MEVMSILTNPVVLSGVCAVGFIITFGMLFVQVNLRALYTTNGSGQGWWVGTLLTSAIVLLCFYVCFNGSKLFNETLLFLLIGTFLVTHTSLLLTQMNMQVQ